MHREVPVAGRVGLQRVNGRIDLLVEDSICWGVLDHKTYPGGHDRWPRTVLCATVGCVWRSAVRQEHRRSVGSCIFRSRASCWS